MSIHGVLGFSGIRTVESGKWSKADSSSQVPYTLAKERLHSPFSDGTCMVQKPCRALGGFHGQKKYKTPLTSPPPPPLGKEGFLLCKSDLLEALFGEQFVGVTLGLLVHWGLAWRLSTLVAGLLMATWFRNQRLIFLQFPSIVSSPLGFVEVLGLNSGGRAFTLFGPRPLRKVLKLVKLVLGL